MRTYKKSFEINLQLELCINIQLFAIGKKLAELWGKKVFFDHDLLV